MLLIHFNHLNNMEGKREKIEDNIVLVGNKPVTVYAFSIKTIFEKGLKEVIIKSRGKTILNAISIVEFMKRTEQLEVNEIKTSSAEHVQEDGKKVYVAAIEIKVIQK